MVVKKANGREFGASLTKTGQKAPEWKSKDNIVNISKNFIRHFHKICLT